MTKVERIVLYSVLGVLFVLAAIFDLSITQALYNPFNGFGQAFEFLGELPVYIVGAFAACTIALHHPQASKRLHLFLLIFFLVAAVGVSVYSGYHTEKLIERVFLTSFGTPAKLGLIALIGAVVFGIGFLLSKLIKPEHSREAFLLCVFILVLIACSLLLMQALKMIWLRPRWRTLVALQEVGALSSAESQWLPFYHPQFFTSFSKYKAGGSLGFTQDQINAVMAKLGVTKWEKEEFYSFPSGHTMNSFAGIALCFLPTVFPKLGKYKHASLFIRIFFYVLVALVALSRIVRGAHNATDVLAGYIFGVLLFDLGSRFFYQRFLCEKFLPKAAA